MNVLVTGGGGFIGAALVKRLLEMEHQVTGFSRGDYPELRQIGVDTIQGDLIDKNSVTAACAKKDTVFHVAAKAGIWGRYEDYYQANVKGTENIIKACLKQGVKYLIFTSSASVVFNGKKLEGIDETLPYPFRSISHYTSTKALAEQMVLGANSSELKTISLRPHLVWGPGDRHIIPRIIKRAKSGKLRKIGNSKNLIDTTFIDNCISAHICAANAIKENPEAAGKTYFISNGEPLPVWDFINNLLKSANLPPVQKTVSHRTALILAGFLELIYSRFKIKNEPYLTRFLIKELCTSHWFNISEAKKQLGYIPKISLEDGFKQLASWYQKEDKNG